MSGQAVNEHPKTRNWLMDNILWVFVGGAVVVFLIGMSLRHPHQDQPMNTRVAAYGSPNGAPSIVAAREWQPQSPEGTVCPPYSEAGASCRITPKGSEWVRIDSSAPVGLHLCLDQDLTAFKEVWYQLSDGSTGRLVAGTMPSGIVALRYVPLKDMTIGYNLAPKCAARSPA